MGGSKNVKEPNEKKRFSIIYQRKNVQNQVIEKMKGLKEPN